MATYTDSLKIDIRDQWYRVQYRGQDYSGRADDWDDAFRRAKRLTSRLIAGANDPHR